jgi:hypothetical protein
LLCSSLFITATSGNSVKLRLSGSGGELGSDNNFEQVVEGMVVKEEREGEGGILGRVDWVYIGRIWVDRASVLNNFYNL